MRLLQTHQVPNHIQEQRLYDYVQGLFAELPSRKSTKKAISAGSLKVNGENSETGWWLKGGEILELYDLELKPPKTYHLRLDVIYEDEDLAVIVKPPGLVVSGNQFKTLMNVLPHNLSKSKSPDALPWPQLTHRLDKLTSGLTLVAKTKTARIGLGQQFENQEIDKTYMAIVMGKLEGNGVFTDPIESKYAETKFEVLEHVRSLKSNFLSLVKLHPKTGRTHQIRIHLSRAGFPILGDQKYGPKDGVLKGKGLFLSATEISFVHPVKNERLQFAIKAAEKFAKRMKNEDIRWNKYRSV